MSEKAKGKRYTEKEKARILSHVDKVNATIPKDVKPEDVTMDLAVAWIADKAAKKGGRKKAPPPRHSHEYHPPGPPP